MTIINDNEILQIFIEDSREHLQGIENDLLAIEARGEDIDSELVNKVFRAVHSIKGGAGFLGLDTIKELAHEMENLLNMIRNRKLVPTSAIITTLLSAADVLTNLVNNPKSSNEANITEQLVALRDATITSLPIQRKQTADSLVDISLPGDRVVFTLSEFDLAQAQKGGHYFYLVEYDLIKDIEEKGKTPLGVMKELQQTGMLLESRVDVEAVGAFEQYTTTVSLPFFILFATILEPDLVRSMLDIDPSRIHHLSKAELKACAGKAKPVEQEIASSLLAEVVTSPAESTLKDEAVLVQSQPESSPPKPENPMPCDHLLPLPPERTQTAKTEEKVPMHNKAPVVDNSLRVNVKVLDTLMTLAGELVLTRNQLVQNVSVGNTQVIETTTQRLNLITSELQEAIVSTRMQPIGNVFNKFQRVVRDMSKELGKEVDLIIEGEEVELDKTIIEAISDPLTHLVRNAVDHGIEIPEMRKQAGKKSTGTLKLNAFHEAGQVIIEVTDEGAGINPVKVKEKALAMGLYDKSQLETMTETELIKLIFLPGFSMAQKVTDISGRGVGMDVVHTNLTKLGGTIDIDSQVGRGSTIRIKLPLTLAIIPSLIVAVDDGRYAIPQVNLVELVRVPAGQVKKRIEKIGSALVMRLRGKLLPLIHLRDVLKIPIPTFRDPESGELCSDRRKNIADRRQENLNDEPETNTEWSVAEDRRRSSADRRSHPQSTFNIVVVAAGDLHYGLIVDTLLDSEEIVVKPLGRHLRGCKIYAGATIQGDGRVALILDVVGISKTMRLAEVGEVAKKKTIQKQRGKRQDAQSLLIVKNASHEQFAIPLGLVSRTEKIHKSQIEFSGGRMDIQYRGGNLVLFSIEEVAHVSPRADLDHLYAIVFPFAGREVGLLVSQIVDVVETDVPIDDVTFRQPGILGSAIILGATTLLVDLYGIVATVKPEWIADHKTIEKEAGKKATILVVEDSNFFRNQIKAFIEEAGYTVLTVSDGLQALETLETYGAEIDLILTDIEMPNLDGIGLTERIRNDSRFAHLPVIVVTSVAGETAEQRGVAAGVDAYMIKLDREKVLETMKYYLERKREAVGSVVD